jgi:hypothetical protein
MLSLKGAAELPRSKGEEKRISKEELRERREQRDKGKLATKSRSEPDAEKTLLAGFGNVGSTMSAILGQRQS